MAVAVKVAYDLVVRLVTRHLANLAANPRPGGVIRAFPPVQPVPLNVLTRNEIEVSVSVDVEEDSARVEAGKRVVDQVLFPFARFGASQPVQFGAGSPAGDNDLGDPVVVEIADHAKDPFGGAGGMDRVSPEGWLLRAGRHTQASRPGA